MNRTLSITAILFAVILFAVSANTVQAATVGGVVLDARGTAVGGALVVIQQVDVPRGQRPYAARLQSDRRGAFIFNGIPGGRYVVTATTRAAQVRAEVALRAEGASRVRLVLPGRRVQAGGDERE